MMLMSDSRGIPELQTETPYLEAYVRACCTLFGERGLLRGGGGGADFYSLWQQIAANLVCKLM